MTEVMEKMYVYNNYGVNVSIRGETTGDNCGIFWEKFDCGVTKSEA